MPRFGDGRRRPTIPDDAAVEVQVDGVEVGLVAAASLAEHPAAVVRTEDFHCVAGWSVQGLRWRGVPLVSLLGELTEVGALPPHVTVSAHDGARSSYLTEDLVDGRSLLATHLDDVPLDERRGAPVRLVTPHLYGHQNVKHVRAIRFTREPVPGRWGAKAHPRARVEHEERHSRLPTWLVRVPYRLTIPVIAALGERR